MGLPCGIDLDFTALKDKLNGMKDSALAEINSTVAAAKAAAQAKMDEFESTIRGWVDELPDLPESDGTPMLAELQSLAADIKALESMAGAELDAAMKALALKRKEFEEKFGDALAKAGAELDSLVSGLNDGIDPCSLVPNILTKPDGTVTEVPNKPLYAKEDSTDETPSTEVGEMKALRGKISEDISVVIATTEVTEAKMEQLPPKTEIKDLITNSPDIDTYYSVAKKVEELDLEMEALIVSRPSPSKDVLENVRQVG